MLETKRWIVMSLGLSVAASVSCGDDESQAFDSNGATESGGSAAESTSPSGASPSESSPSASSDSAATPTSTSGSSTGAGSSSDGSTTEDSSSPLLDVGNPDGGLGPCGCDLAYIWIANADEGTVSKINVRTLEEEGRYITRPDGAGNPSRTSVSLGGDVAVANRTGGLVKIYADQDDCQESNGMPGIQTSQGAGDVLPWEMEECRAWYTEFGETNQRPVAWIAGDMAAGDCDAPGQQVWTVHSETPGIPGTATGGFGGVVAVLVNGDTGDVDDEVLVPEFDGFQLGAYGGAVNAQGELFVIPMGSISIGPDTLLRVNPETMESTVWTAPDSVNSYGITVDHNGRVWISSTLGAGAARFDPEDETWEILTGFMSLGGLAEGPDNHIWIAMMTGAISFDVDTLEPGNVFANNQINGIKGISTDVDGYVWAVDERAWKIDPSTGAHIDRYDGLTSAYTYSDMTGFALGNVACPPEG